MKIPFTNIEVKPIHIIGATIAFLGGAALVRALKSNSTISTAVEVPTTSSVPNSADWVGVQRDYNKDTISDDFSDEVPGGFGHNSGGSHLSNRIFFNTDKPIDLSSADSSPYLKDKSAADNFPKLSEFDDFIAGRRLIAMIGDIDFDGDGFIDRVFGYQAGETDYAVVEFGGPFQNADGKQCPVSAPRPLVPQFSLAADKSLAVYSDTGTARHPSKVSNPFKFGTI